MRGSTSTTKTPVETIALLAIVQHAADHQLTMHGIDTPNSKGQPFVIRLAADHLEDWLNTLDNISPATEKPIQGSDAHSVRHTGKVPTALRSVHVETLTIVRATSGLRLIGGYAS